MTEILEDSGYVYRAYLKDYTSTVFFDNTLITSVNDVIYLFLKDCKYLYAETRKNNFRSVNKKEQLSAVLNKFMTNNPPRVYFSVRGDFDYEEDKVFVEGEIVYCPLCGNKSVELMNLLDSDEDIQINTEFANDLPVEVTKKESVMNSEVNKKEVFNKGDLVYFPLVSDEPLILLKSNVPINPKFPFFIDNQCYSFNSEGMMEECLTQSIWRYSKENSEKLSEFYGRTFEYELSGELLAEFFTTNFN